MSYAAHCQGFHIHLSPALLGCAISLFIEEEVYTQEMLGDLPRSHREGLVKLNLGTRAGLPLGTVAACSTSVPAYPRLEFHMGSPWDSKDFQ